MSKILLGRRGLIHRRLWPALDAAVRDQVIPAALDDSDARAIMRLLKREGRVRSADRMHGLLDATSGMNPKRVQKLVASLEALGLVLTEPALLDNHKHTAFVLLWTERFPRPLSSERSVDKLVKATLWAAGDVPEKEILRWFAWPRSETAPALEMLRSSTKISMVSGHVRWSG